MQYTRKYGYPPAQEECTPKPLPPSLTDTTGFLKGAVGPGIVEQLMGISMLPRTAALLITHHYGDKQPISVVVPEMGTFLIGPKGWEVVDTTPITD